MSSGLEIGLSRQRSRQRQRFLGITLRLFAWLGAAGLALPIQAQNASAVIGAASAPNSSVQPQTGAPQRDLPTNAYLVTLSFVQNGATLGAIINGNAVNLAPGLRVRDGFNRFILKQDYPTTAVSALVRPDLMGNLLEVWLLRADEVRLVMQRAGQGGIPGYRP